MICRRIPYRSRQRLSCILSSEVIAIRTSSCNRPSSRKPLFSRDSRPTPPAHVPNLVREPDLERIAPLRDTDRQANAAPGRGIDEPPQAPTAPPSATAPSHNSGPPPNASRENAVDGANMASSGAVSALQRLYDDCYLTCSTAIYYEGQVRVAPPNLYLPTAGTC